MVCICGHYKSEHIDGQECSHMFYLVNTLCTCVQYEEAGL